MVSTVVQLHSSCFEADNHLPVYVGLDILLLKLHITSTVTSHIVFYSAQNAQLTGAGMLSVCRPCKPLQTGPIASTIIQALCYTPAAPGHTSSCAARTPTFQHLTLP